MTSRSALRRLRASTVFLPTMVAAGLVLYDLDSRSLWVDEGTTVAIATKPTGALWHWMAQDGGNMAAYYAFMHVVFRIFGTGMLAIRLPAALAMVATVPVAYHVVRRLFGSGEALAGALLVAVSFPLVYWAQQARAYSFAVLAATGSVLCFVMAVQGGSRWWWYGYVLLSALAVYCSLLCAFVLVSVWCSLVFCDKARVPPWRTLAAAAGAIAVLCVPLYVMVAARGSGQLEWVPPLTAGTTGSIWQFLTSARESHGSLLEPDGALFVLSLFACAGSIAWLGLIVRSGGRSGRAWSLGLLLCWFAVPVAITFALAGTGEHVAVDRFFLPSVVPISLLAGCLIARLRPAPLAWGACAILVFLRGGALVPSYGHSVEDWRGAAKLIATRDPAPTCLAFFEAGGWLPFEYYAKRLGSPADHVVLPSDPANPLPPYLETLGTSSLSRVLPTCPTLWLVTTHVGGQASTAFERDKKSTYQQLLSSLLQNYRAVSAEKFTGVSVELLRRS